MTQETQRNLINRERRAQRNILALEDAAQEAAVSGTASATISTSGGSKSYSRMTPDQITALIGYWRRELIRARRSIRGVNNPIQSVKIVRS